MDAKQLNSLQLALAAMSLSVPVLYLVGYFYYLGYLSTFGLNIDVFPRGIQDHLVYAFMVFFS